MLQKLQNVPEADPRALGIKRHVPFPSGALLVTCRTTAQAEQLRSVAADAGISEKVRAAKPPTFRIHTIPPNTKAEQIKEDLLSCFGPITADLQLFPYKNHKFAGQNFAVVQTTLDNLKKISKIKSIRIGWAFCRIDASIHVTCCRTCGLLGHSEQKCQQMDANEMDNNGNSDTANGNSPVCKDCSHYNTRQSASTATTGVKVHRRPTAHLTGSKNCPTLLALKKKTLPLRTPVGQSTKESSK